MDICQNKLFWCIGIVAYLLGCLFYFIFYYIIIIIFYSLEILQSPKGSWFITFYRNWLLPNLLIFIHLTRNNNKKLFIKQWLSGHLTIQVAARNHKNRKYQDMQFEQSLRCQDSFWEGLGSLNILNFFSSFLWFLFRSLPFIRPERANHYIFNVLLVM